jgi:hypothetical protein
MSINIRRQNILQPRIFFKKIFIDRALFVMTGAHQSRAIFIFLFDGSAAAHKTHHVRVATRVTVSCSTASPTPKCTRHHTTSCIAFSRSFSSLSKRHGNGFFIF